MKERGENPPTPLSEWGCNYLQGLKSNAKWLQEQQQKQVRGERSIYSHAQPYPASW